MPTTTELYQKIIARLDELDAMEGAATKGEFKVIVADQCRLIALSGTEQHYIMVLADNNADENAALIATARNLFPGLLAFMRQQAEWALEGALYGDGGTQLAKDYLRSIAVAIGAEVGDD